MKQDPYKRLENTATFTAFAGIILALWQEMAQSRQGEWIILAGLCLFFGVIDQLILLAHNLQDPSKANPFGFPLVVSLLVLLILIPLLTATTAVRYYKATDNVAYSIKRGVCTVVDSYGADDKLVLLDEYKGKPVTVIGKSALSYRKSAKEIILPAQLEKIENSAFLNCASLEELTLPDSVTSIGKNAFSGCKHLQRITIPASVTSIPRNAFKGCPKDLVIVGEPGSAAQTFAEKYFTFEALSPGEAAA